MAKKDYVRYINSLLNENTEQSKQELSDLFADEEFRKNDMLEDTRMGYMYIAICIYREEKAAHIEENILMNVDSLESSPNLCVNSSFSYVVLSTLLLSSRDLTEWSLVYHNTLSYQRFYDLHSIHYDHLEGLHQLI